MLKSVMAFFDLVFPMKVKPLTYKNPDGMEAPLPGTVVEAELKNTVKRALILCETLPGGADGEDGKFKEIGPALTEGPAVSGPLLSLIKWMAGYYMVPEGSVLKAMFGGDLFEKGRPREAKEKKEKAEKAGAAEEASSAVFTFPADVTAAMDRVRQAQGYRAFLLHAPGGAFERDFVLEAARDHKGVIIACPERSSLPEYERRMRPVFGGRMCVLHGGLSPAKRRLLYEKILSGETDVVLGTRVAVFAPLRKVSLIALTAEEDPNYKNREDVKYGAREVAVMRAYLEKARVLLSSICPSAESYMNALRGKYEYLRFAPQRPAIRVVSDLKLKNRGRAEIMDQAVAHALARALEKGQSALLVADRPGHSVPVCEDCGHFERCPSCGTALVLHKNDPLHKNKSHKAGGSLSCHHCGFDRDAPETCALCGGHGLKPLGAGIERLREEAERLLPAAPIKAQVHGPGKNKNAAPEGAGEAARSAFLYLGTKRISKAAKGPGNEGPAIAALVHPESAFFRPGFRARERVFAELNYLADRLSPGGKIMVQTSTPELFRAMKGLDYEWFMKAELEERKALGYPPFSKLAQIIIKTADGKTPPRFMINPAGGNPETHGAKTKILGPAERMDEKGRRFFSVLVMAPSAQALKKAVNEALKSIPPGGKKVAVDIDPV